MQNDKKMKLMVFLSMNKSFDIGATACTRTLVLRSLAQFQQIMYGFRFVEISLPHSIPQVTLS
jgi:hypothetical protein